MRRPVIELSECILCELCISVAPTVFRMNDAGYVEIAELDDYPVDDVKEAVKNCPKDCIYWE